jgi:homoserine/homoserine lactone efflux protein
VTLQAWLWFCATETVLCFTPGPAVLLVVSLSLTSGARAGFGATLGILAANAFYFILSATGIGAVLLASYDLFFLIKWAGALYLIWIGARMLLLLDGGFEGAVAEGGKPGSRRGLKPFAHGLVTQGANPKAIVFFTALLPQFIDPASPVPMQVAILGISSVLIEVGVLGLYIAACHRARAVVRRPGLSNLLSRAGGLLLIGAGAGMAALRRS